MDEGLEVGRELEEGASDEEEAVVGGGEGGSAAWHPGSTTSSPCCHTRSAKAGKSTKGLRFPWYNSQTFWLRHISRALIGSSRCHCNKVVKFPIAYWSALGHLLSTRFSVLVSSPSYRTAM